MRWVLTIIRQKWVLNTYNTKSVLRQKSPVNLAYGVTEPQKIVGVYTPTIRQLCWNLAPNTHVSAEHFLDGVAHSHRHTDAMYQ